MSRPISTIVVLGKGSVDNILFTAYTRGHGGKSAFKNLFKEVIITVDVVVLFA